MSELGCPHCGEAGSLYTQEVMYIEYPITLTVDEGKASYEYTGEESREFDDSAEPEKDDRGRDKLVCRSCSHEFTLDDVTVQQEIEA